MDAGQPAVDPQRIRLAAMAERSRTAREARKHMEQRRFHPVDPRQLELARRREEARRAAEDERLRWQTARKEARLLFEARFDARSDDAAPAFAPRYETRWAREDEAEVAYAFVKARAERACAPLVSPGAFAAAYRRSFLPDSTFRFAFVERRGRPVGAASLHRGFSARRGRPTVEVQDDHVLDGEDAAHEELLRFAEAYARSLGAVALTARALPDEAGPLPRHGYERQPDVVLQKSLA